MFSIWKLCKLSFLFLRKAFLPFLKCLLICDQPFSLLKPSKVSRYREGHAMAVLHLETHLQALYLFCENLLYRCEFLKFWRGPKAERASGRSPVKALCVCPSCVLAGPQLELIEMCVSLSHAFPCEASYFPLQSQFSFLMAWAALKPNLPDNNSWK